jgi:uncharacterized protein with HEPN domain
MSRDNASILDLGNHGRRVVRFVQGLDYDAFLDDEKTQAAVLHELMIIGEAVKPLSPRFRQQYAVVQWQSIAGMRDIVIHQYDDVDLNEVWKTVEQSVPALLRFLEPLVPQDEAQ